jgi:hypothetical protein
LQRYGLVAMTGGTAHVAITAAGSQLLLAGEVDIREELAG